jgi:prolyl-tRNA editing enzyme YbaK/EbsC (Cys-tRNA(Pro) deacylase)
MMPAPMTMASTPVFADAVALSSVSSCTWPTVHGHTATATATRHTPRQNGCVSDIETSVRDALERTGTVYELVACDPALADTAAFCEAYGYSPDESANTIVVAGKSEPPRLVACIVLATTRLDVNGAVRRRLGVRKASFASADDTMAATGMAIGGVTPFALPAEMEIWVDAEVMRRDRLILGGGSRSMKVLAPPATLVALANVTVVDDLAMPFTPT